jgi:hypothetical protein
MIMIESDPISRVVFCVADMYLVSIYAERKKIYKIA